jgi:hypothetical protein
MIRKESPLFDEMVDDLVEFSQHDQELADSIAWLDERARKHNVSFYDEVYEVLVKHEARTKAKEWLRLRNDS